MFQKMFLSFVSACGKAVIHIENDCQISSIKELIFQLSAYLAQIESQAKDAAEAQKAQESKPVEAQEAPKE
jgi:hypothetical protein